MNRAGDQVLRDLEKQLKDSIAAQMAKPFLDSAKKETQKEVKMLQVKEFADLMQVHPLTVYGWVKDRKIKAAQPAGKHGRIVIPSTEFDRLMALRGEISERT